MSDSNNINNMASSMMFTSQIIQNTNSDSTNSDDKSTVVSASWASGDEKNKKDNGWKSSWSRIGKTLSNDTQNAYRIISIDKIVKPFFVLKIFIDSTDNYELYKKYVAAAEKQNSIVKKYKMGEKNIYFDAGFDLFYPEKITVSDARSGTKVYKLDHLVKCSMEKVTFDTNGKENRHPVGYYMYPRSSTGTKTPLRLANSVGIIDSGYRGHIISAFDSPPQFTCKGGSYTVEAYQRLVQLCPPDLSYPMEIKLVADASELGDGGERGSSGFGSSGV